MQDKEEPGEIREELLHLLYELIASAGDASGTPGDLELPESLLSKIPPKLLAWLLTKRFPLRPFLEHIPSNRFFPSRATDSRIPSNILRHILRRRWRILRKSLLSDARRRKSRHSPTQTSRSSPADPALEVTLADLQFLSDARKRPRRVHNVWRLHGKALVKQSSVASGQWSEQEQWSVVSRQSSENASSHQPLATSHYWQGAGNLTLSFWENLIEAQAGELAAVRGLAQEVSRKTGRVVFSWHNASLAAAGGWAFEPFSALFSSAGLYRSFVRDVLDDAARIRESFDLQTASELFEMRARRLFAPKAAHALEQRTLLSMRKAEFLQRFEMGPSAGLGQPCAAQFFLTAKKRWEQYRADSPLEGGQGGVLGLDKPLHPPAPPQGGNYGNPPQEGNCGDPLQISNRAMQWAEGILAPEGASLLIPQSSALSPGILAQERAPHGKAEWTGPLSPHQQVSPEQVFAWQEAQQKGWAEGLILLFAMASRGQKMIDSGKLSSLVLPWIDKFFISSLRKADQGYLAALFRFISLHIEKPLILFWEDTAHARIPSLSLALEDLSKQGLPFRGIGVFDTGTSSRSEAEEIVRQGYPEKSLFALRPLNDTHCPDAYRRIFRDRDFHFFQSYDSSWKDNLVFIYSGTQVFPLLSVQTEMETICPWICAGRGCYPFGAWLRQRLRGRLPWARNTLHDPLCTAYGSWANLL